MKATHTPRSNQSEPYETHPTVLVAAEEELRATVVRSLQTEGYIVLEAGNAAEALHIVISHSRSIEVLLADVRIGGQMLARTLNPYRPAMQLVLIRAHAHDFSGALDPIAAAAKIREILNLPAAVAKPVTESRRTGIPNIARTA